MRMKTFMKAIFGLTIVGGGAAYYFEADKLIQLTPQIAEASPEEPKSFHDKFQAALNDLKIEDTKLGTGELAIEGKPLKIHYVAKLADGTEFDSSIGRKDPLVFVLGRAQALPGLDRGIVGMKVGGKRRLTIPAFLGYGQNGVGTLVPPGSTLVFDVELLAVGSERSRGKVARVERKILSKERRPAKSRSKPSQRRA
ncbi:MAG TPA: FKBP-type peptidyl-prolyl cis-trans isomerase [Bdellovibrionota bacterium]|nr:FKBP-type peptidyl-prolyl cis-trans isomerase [Bdellovibrionota bacterium]